MNYRCKLESNWRTFIGAHERGNLIEIEIGTIKSGTTCEKRAREARDTWARDKFYAAQKRHTGWLLYCCANASGRLAKLNGARSSIIDGGFCHKKRTKVIQIAVTLNNESHDRLVNFYAIYRLYRTHMQDSSEPSHIFF